MGWGMAGQSYLEEHKMRQLLWAAMLAGALCGVHRRDGGKSARGGYRLKVQTHWHSI